MRYEQWVERRAEAAIREEGRLPLDHFSELMSAGLDAGAFERRILNTIEQEQSE